MGKEKLIPIMAMIVLLVGISSTIYVHASIINKETITIKGEEYTFDQLSLMSKTRTINTDEGEKTGIALDDLIINAGIGCPSCHKYTFKAKDGYQQTIDWEHMKKGILSKESRIFFPDTAHALWVRDIIEIEVE